MAIEELPGAAATPVVLRGGSTLPLALLCAAITAVLTGDRSLIAISERITDAPQHVLNVLDFDLDPSGLQSAPHAAAVRRLPHRVDTEVLDAAISAYPPTRAAPAPSPDGNRQGRQVIVVDGKLVCGSRTRTARQSGCRPR
ncbi:hypothetical protein [Streptomyces sp. NPDC055013]